MVLHIYGTHCFSNNVSFTVDEGGEVFISASLTKNLIGSRFTQLVAKAVCPAGRHDPVLRTQKVKPIS